MPVELRSDRTDEASLHERRLFAMSIFVCISVEIWDQMF
jgi:hypothetical protein